MWWNRQNNPFVESLGNSQVVEWSVVVQPPVTSALIFENSTVKEREDQWNTLSPTSTSENVLYSDNRLWVAAMWVRRNKKIGRGQRYSGIRIRKIQKKVWLNLDVSKDYHPFDSLYIANPNNFQPIQISQLSAKHRFIRSETHWNGYRPEGSIFRCPTFHGQNLPMNTLIVCPYSTHSSVALRNPENPSQNVKSNSLITT